MEALHTVIEGNVTAKVVQDTDPSSPAEWDNVGKIAYCGREVLGTEYVTKDRMAEINAGLASGKLIGMPVWAYVHSGATIKAADRNPFSCPWDSGCSGFVYTTREKALAEFGKKVVTKKVIERTLACLKAEVEAYDQYLQGDVYGVIVEDAEGNQLDSCWGMYGLDYAKEEARSMAVTAQDGVAA